MGIRRALGSWCTVLQNVKLILASLEKESLCTECYSNGNTAIIFDVIFPVYDLDFFIDKYFFPQNFFAILKKTLQSHSTLVKYVMIKLHSLRSYFSLTWKTLVFTKIVFEYLFHCKINWNVKRFLQKISVVETKEPSFRIANDLLLLNVY